MRRLLPALLLLAAPAAAAEWRLQAATGTAHSFASTLGIELANQASREVDAQWETRPFEGAIYYSVRLSRQSGRRAWELQLLHHKVYLANPSPPITSFEVTHGYNLVTLSLAAERQDWSARLGAGVVVAHPEAVIDGQAPRPSGYALAGPAVILGAGRRLGLGAHAFLSGEAALSLAWGHVDVPGGQASVPNRALHALVGLGARF